MLISMQRLQYDLLKVICQIAANWPACNQAQCEYILTCVFPALRWVPKDLWQPGASLNTNKVRTNTVGKDAHTRTYTHKKHEHCQQNDTADAISIFALYRTWQSQQVALSLLIICEIHQRENRTLLFIHTCAHISKNMVKHTNVFIQKKTTKACICRIAGLSEGTVCLSGVESCPWRIAWIHRCLWSRYCWAVQQELEIHHKLGGLWCVFWLKYLNYFPLFLKHVCPYFNVER